MFVCAFGNLFRIHQLQGQKIHDAYNANGQSMSIYGQFRRLIALFSFHLTQLRMHLKTKNSCYFGFIAVGIVVRPKKHINVEYLISILDVCFIPFFNV